MHTEVSVGTLNASLVQPREVFGPAVREGAHSILLAHNHPSGDPQPSPEDRELTTRLRECGTLLGIEVLDHVIVGNGTGRWLSFQDAGLW
jgi:DNA repair protein RadC